MQNIAGHLADGVSEPVLVRAFEYWRNIDEETGRNVEKAVRDLIGGTSEEPGMASAEAVREPEPAE
ncbi:catalase-related domain-containing protein [Sphingomonas kaistensis]|uniref:Catalase-related domain-containing protein n=1 Tax=Sphingomonas kaistensis TaxID=298708 RepID=A0ABZ2G3R4_9SPHN